MTNQDLPSVNEHLEKLTDIEKSLLENKQQWILIENGRNIQERSFVAVSGERVLGFGFVELLESINNWEDVVNRITHPVKSNSTIQSILMHHLEKHQPELILFEDSSDKLRTIVQYKIMNHWILCIIILLMEH